MAKSGTSTSTVRLPHLTGDTSGQPKTSALVFGPKASRALIQLARLLEKIPKTEQLHRVFGAVREACQADTSRTRDAVILSLLSSATESSSGLKDIEVELLASLLYIFVTESRRCLPLGTGSSRESLIAQLRESRLPPLYLEQLADMVLPEQSSSIFPGSYLRMSAQNSLIRLNWRLDVIITSHLGKKILEPVFLVSLGTTTGTRVIEIPVASFHKLRFVVATVLQEMNSLSSRKVLAT